MPTHTLHDPIIEGGLVNGCPGCKQLAQYPLQCLDSSNLSMYVDRTIRWMRDDMDARPRSDMEYEAMSKLEDIISDVRIINEKGLLQIITERNS
jgi:hypothetical protein